MLKQVFLWARVKAAQGTPLDTLSVSGVTVAWSAPKVYPDTREGKFSDADNSTRKHQLNKPSKTSSNRPRRKHENKGFERAAYGCKGRKKLHECTKSGKGR